jgi:hypothetical protein
MRKLSVGAIVLLLTLLAILAGTIFFVYQGMLVGGDETLPGHFYIAMSLGIGFSMLVGVGLMALVFYSHRRGHDEPPTFR